MQVPNGPKNPPGAACSRAGLSRFCTLYHLFLLGIQNHSHSAPRRTFSWLLFLFWTIVSYVTKSHGGYTTVRTIWPLYSLHHLHRDCEEWFKSENDLNVQFITEIIEGLIWSPVLTPKLQARSLHSLQRRTKLQECKIHINSNGVEPTGRPSPDASKKKKRKQFSGLCKKVIFPLFISFCWMISQENETEDENIYAVSGRTNEPMCCSTIRSSGSPQHLILRCLKARDRGGLRQQRGRGGTISSPEPRSMAAYLNSAAISAFRSSSFVGWKPISTVSLVTGSSDAGKFAEGETGHDSTTATGLWIINADSLKWTFVPYTRK